MSFQRILTQTGKDGRLRKLYPFHISLEGMESVLLCRDDEDYDHLQKSFYLSAWKMGCRVVSEIAMSNHGHVALLSSGIEQARQVGELIKKRHSQYISWKYGDSKLLKRSDICVKYLDTDWYVRNALAYIPRNAVGTGGRVEDYRWSSYRGMFVAGRCPSGVRRVADLSSRERERLFHSHEDLTGVPWVLNADGNLEPVSACDFQYLESAFNHDQAFYLKTIGSVNEAEMRQMLVLNGREKQADVEMQAIPPGRKGVRKDNPGTVPGAEGTPSSLPVSLLQDNHSAVGPLSAYAQRPGIRPDPQTGTWRPAGKYSVAGGTMKCRRWEGELLQVGK